jgi:hypothetical protein
MEQEKLKSITGDITPLPWKINENQNQVAKWIDIDNEAEVPVISFEAYWNKNNHKSKHDFWQLEQKNNPIYIVKACNLFPELIEALEEVIVKLVTDEKFLSTQGKELISKTKELIQKSKIIK